MSPVGNTFTVTCRYRMSVQYFANGTTRVPSITFANCVTNALNCAASVVATSGSHTPLGWGNRLVRVGTTSPAVYRDRTGVSFTKTFSNLVPNACPVPSGGYADNGVLSLRLTGGTAGSASAILDGAAAGTVSGSLGPWVATGTLVLEAGQPAIYFV